jgi:hypothetical protein
VKSATPVPSAPVSAIERSRLKRKIVRFLKSVEKVADFGESGSGILEVLDF